MIVHFSVGNYRSILDEQGVSLVTTSGKSNNGARTISTTYKAIPRLSRYAVLFGPNASGKSNYLQALKSMQEWVLRSTRFSTSDLEARYTPFYDRASVAEPTQFAIELLLDGTRYRYRFAYDAKRVIAEELLVYGSNRPQRWFGREMNKSGIEIWSIFSAEFKGPREMWRQATKPQALFLTTAGQLNAKQLQPLLHWFEHKLVVLPSLTNVSSLAKRLANATFKQRALGVMNDVDFPISDIRVEEQTHSPTGNPSGRQSSPPPSIEFLHTSATLPPRWLNSDSDATGALQLLLLLDPLLDGMGEDRLVVIDEFDTHLHPLVARYLLQLIGDPAVTQHFFQAILVTKNVALMDLTVLRRDEIWLVKANAHRATQITSLLDYRPRPREPVANAYLRGRYDAVPHIKANTQPPRS